NGGLGSAATLTLEDAEALMDPSVAPAVLAVAPEADTTAQLVAGRTNTFTRVIGVTQDYQDVRGYEVAEGRFIDVQDVQSSSRVAVLGSNVRDRLFGEAPAVGE